MISIILTSLIFFAWWSWLTAWWDSAETSERVIGAFVLTVTQITAVGICLGMIGWFRWWAVVPVHLIITGILCWCAGGRDFTTDFKRIRAALRIAYQSEFVGITTVLALAACALSVWLAFRLPPMGYDVYHLVKAALLVQTGHIQPWGWDGRGTDFYPANMEMVTGYVLMLSRDLSRVCLVQLVFAGALALMCYRTCRNFGVRHSWSAVSGLMLFGVVPVIAESWLALNDLAVAAMVGVGWGMLTGRRVGWGALVISGLAWGWAIGCKLSTGYWLIGALIYFIWRVMNDGKRSKIEEEG